MDEKIIGKVLSDLAASSDDILLSMLINADGFPMCSVGMDVDADFKGALYTELAHLAARISGELDCGETEEIFVRSRKGCIVIWPISELAVLACMATSNIDSFKMQMLTWKAVAKLKRIVWQVPDPVLAEDAGFEDG